MENQMTIREIRRVLFETEKYIFISKESRDFLYKNNHQDDELMNVIDGGTYLLIWK